MSSKLMTTIRALITSFKINRCSPRASFAFCPTLRTPCSVFTPFDGSCYHGINSYPY